MRRTVMFARSGPVAGVLRKADIKSVVWCEEAEKKHHSLQEQQETQWAQQIVFCLLLVTYFNLFQQPASMLHTQHTQCWWGSYGQMHEKMFSTFFFSSYAYIAAYFPVTNYMFADTHTGAEHHNVLLEMLNICEKLKSFVYFILCNIACILCNLACFSICQCHTCRTIFQWPVLSFCKQEV